jgi:hypothetical protein
MVCDKDFEIRQPQDFVRGKADMQVPPYTKPEQSNAFQPLTVAWQTEDNISLLEVFAKEFTIVVPDSVEYTGTGNQELGARYLGEMSLGGDSIFKGYNSRVSVSESVVITQGFDRVTSDSISVSEVFTAQIITNPLGNRALGSTTLGF